MWLLTSTMSRSEHNDGGVQLLCSRDLLAVEALPLHQASKSQAMPEYIRFWQLYPNTMCHEVARRHRNQPKKILLRIYTLIAHNMSNETLGNNANSNSSLPIPVEIDPFPLSEIDKWVLSLTDEEFHLQTWEDLKKIIGTYRRSAGL